MPTHDFKDIGDVLAFDVLKGTIASIDSANDTCMVSVGGTILDALLFYHCKPDSVMRDNGAIEGAAAGFSVGDEVIVLKRHDNSVVKVIGHTDGIRRCSSGILYIFYIADGVYRVAQCSLSGSSITVNSTKSFAELGISSTGDSYFIHFQLKRFTHNMKDTMTGLIEPRNLYFISTNLRLDETALPFSPDSSDPFAWLKSCLDESQPNNQYGEDPHHWYVFDPVLYRFYYLENYRAPFVTRIYVGQYNWEYYCSINFSEDNNYIYTASIINFVEEYRTVHKYTLLNNELTTVSTAYQPSGWNSESFIGRDGQLIHSGASFPHSSICDVASKDGYYEYNFIDDGQWDIGYVPVFYTQTTMSKNLGNPFIINDPEEYWGDAYYTTPWGETLPAWSGDYTHYLDPHPWINIHTTDLFIQSVYLGDYFAPGPKIQRVYYNDDPWLSALMGAIDVVDGGNFLGIAYLPGA